MRPTRFLIFATGAALLLASCASTAPEREGTSGAEGGSADSQDAPGEPDASKAGGEPASDKDGSGKPFAEEPGSDGQGTGGSGGMGEADEGGGGGAGEPGDGARGESHRDGEGGSTPASAGGPTRPAAGTYIYGQKGFEEFCAPQCERYKLPPKQRIDATYSSRSASSAVVITKARASGDRLVRTTTRYTASAAHVLEVHLEYSYEGFDFFRTYRPSPPVASLRFPLRTGRSWSGRWEGDVSGRYSVEVAGHETFSGSEVARLETATRFSGDLEGRANVTLWVDPGDGTVMKTAGNMTVEMGFGTYRTGFATSLRASP